jgi:FAD/FMN-containing dehydrogenase
LLLRTDRAVRACYRTDGGQIVYGLPDSVVHARSAEDVASLLRMAQRDRIPVTCRGGGLTTEGESVAARGILLDLKGLNRMLDCDGATAWVEAGMTWHQVAEALRPRGLDYTSAPLNMMSTVGGTLGVGGIDVNSPRHGCSADQAVELEVVTPTGDIVRVKEGDAYLERVLLGYGQFGVITKARIKVRPYRPMTVRHFLYADVGVALGDMMRLVDQDAVDACAILTLRDDVIALILGFEDEPKDFPLRSTPESLMVARFALRPWRWRDAGFLMRRKADLLPALQDPLFVRDGRVHDRTVVFSRLIWRYWGGRQIAIPDLAITKPNFEAAARRGIEVCKRHFPYFTLYAVMIRKFGNRPRYEMSAIPATPGSGDDHVCGIEFSPLLEGANYSRDHFQRFKNAIYDVGLDLGGSYYRFGGVMKPYVRRMFGEEMVNRHRAMKQAVDPAFILNRDVVFDPPEAR